MNKPNDFPSYICGYQDEWVWDWCWIAGPDLKSMIGFQDRPGFCLFRIEPVAELRITVSVEEAVE